LTLTDEDYRLLWVIILDEARSNGPGPRIEPHIPSPEMLEDRVQAEPFRLQYEAELQGQMPKGVA